MLVLNRKSMERIQIGDNVVVTVLEICRNKVRIGIAAPREIHVLRSELKEVIPEFPVRGPCTASVEQVVPNIELTVRDLSF